MPTKARFVPVNCVRIRVTQKEGLQFLAFCDNIPSRDLFYMYQIHEKRRASATFVLQPHTAMGFLCFVYMYQVPPKRRASASVSYIPTAV